MREPWWISLIKAGVIVNLIMLAFAYTTWLERKLLGRMQNRFGPNRAGPFGLLQPFADLVKLVRKESFFPVAARHPLYIAAPIISMFTALAAFAVIPFGAGWQVWGYQIDGEIANVSIALILIFALGSIGVYGAIIGGWASQSKFSLLGSMRTCAQLVSYEVSLALSVLGVVLMGQSLNLVDIVNKQGGTIWFFIPQLAGLTVFFFAMIAETSRPPFDLPEADTELVAGFHTEYGGMRWGLFQTAEYINLITLSALAVTLFFAGWHGPYAPLGPLWFLLKVFIFISVFIWIRASVPRLRYDQLMKFGWKILLPVATINAVITALLVVWVLDEPPASRQRQGLRGHVPPALQEADHAAVPGVQAAGLSALPRPAPVAPARQRTGEVRRLLPLRSRLPGRLHPCRCGREHAGESRLAG